MLPIVPKTDERILKFHRVVMRALLQYQLRFSECDELLVLMGERGATEKLLASNKTLRRQADRIMVDLFGKLRIASLSVPTRRFWHVSFIGPHVNEYGPQLDLDDFRVRVDKLLRRAKLNAVCAMELQTLTNYPQRGRGRSFLLNAHALCWADDISFDADKAQAKLRNSSILKSELGAPTVTFIPRTLEPGGIEYLGHYLLKAPTEGKRRLRDPDNSSRWIFKQVANVRPDLQLRLLEILSQIEFTDLVWGVYEGSDIRLEWKQQLVAWNQSRCARLRALDRDFDVAGLWGRVRAKNHKLKPRYVSPIIERKTKPTSP